MKERYDIAVIGAGTAGIAAAVAAAQGGQKVILIERSGVLGGMCTSGLLNCWCGSAESRMMRKIREIGQDICPEEQMKDWQRYDVVRHVYDPEIVKDFFLKEALGAGLTVLLHAVFCEAVMERDMVRAVRVLTKSGILTIEAEIFIDCTGDGDVAAAAGIPYSLGNGNGLFQPVTTMFMVAGVEERRAVYRSSPELEDRMRSWMQEGRIDRPAGHIILIPGFYRGTASVNMTNAVFVNGSDAKELTGAELLTRKQIFQIMDFLRCCVPGYEKAWVCSTAGCAGVRESRHLQGAYIMTGEDVLKQRIFDDWIVSNAGYHFGDHSMVGANDRPDESQSFGGRRYTMPLRSFGSDRVGNLLFAGRCSSGDHAAYSSFRVMPICFAMGEGVGLTAALAVRQRKRPLEVNAAEVQDILIGEYGLSAPAPNGHLEGAGAP